MSVTDGPDICDEKKQESGREVENAHSIPRLENRDVRHPPPRETKKHDHRGHRGALGKAIPPDAHRGGADIAEAGSQIGEVPPRAFVARASSRFFLDQLHLLGRGGCDAVQSLSG
jgi:hypothetical protein